ncbi:hypothetical protein B0J12DRAFT_692532 [Macrophomina phaseolina]|uniref:Uncharacterized protein n=1 Tax=Macrophomina phaseolina TaxID=35725 RepID=A0ABQ8FPE5_9PEZI|nr:hypothetical protein B0J12DRAFT_692532 [Macrophomina phaseolina]
MYSGLLSKLGTLAHVRRMKTAQNALEHLESAELPAAILVVDASITEQGNQKVLDKLKEYVVCGGTAIFCCHFSSFVQFSDLDTIFYSHFGLSWKAGSYTRATLCINSTATEELPSERRLTSTFSQKALHLMHVGHHSALYLTDEFICRSQTPIAWASVGRGQVGYVGDVNAQEETTEVILAMCGL